MRLEIKEVNGGVTFSIDGEGLSADAALWSYDTPNKFSDEMWQDIHNLFNGETGEIQFEGSQEAFNQFSRQFPSNLTNLNIKFIDSKTEQSLRYETELKQWFDQLLATDVLTEQQKENAKARFKEAANNVFVVNVLARVSAGKSTLINALLGQKLMPSNNNAETAKITQIIDNDSTDGFTAIALDDNHNQMYRVDHLSPQKMDELNDDNNVASVQLTGDIPFAKSIDYALELVDTPGPDNVMNKDHHLQFDKLITRQNKNGFKPVVIYVIPADGIGTDSTDDLLNVITKESRADYQESARNRFVFVISKMDTVKPKNVIETLDNAKQYLMKKGIEQPVVIPVSAELALNIRRNDISEDDDEYEELEFKVHKQNKHAEFHFDELAMTNGVSESEPTYDDDMLKALQHSGIVTLESQIRTYINEFAAPARLSRLDSLTDHILSEMVDPTKLVGSMTTVQTELNQVQQDFEDAKENLDDETKVLQEKRLADFKNVKEEIQQLVADSKSQISLVISESFKYFHPTTNTQRSEKLTEINHKLIGVIIQSARDLEVELKKIGEAHNFILPDVDEITETTKALLQQGLNQSSNLTMVEDEAVDDDNTQKTIAAITSYCAAFEDDFTSLLQTNLLRRLKQTKRNLAEQIQELTDTQRQQQGVVDGLVQKRDSLVTELKKLKIVNDLHNSKPSLKESVEA